MTTRAPADQRGFTMPELLVAGVIILVAAIATIALLTPKNFDAQNRNTARRLDLLTIMVATDAYQKVNGALPAAITTEDKQITDEQEPSGFCSDLVPTYLPELPYDPQTGGTLYEGGCASADQIYATGYNVRKNADGTITFSAPDSENGERVEMTYTPR